MVSHDALGRRHAVVQHLMVPAHGGQHGRAARDPTHAAHEILVPPVPETKHGPQILAL